MPVTRIVDYKRSVFTEKFWFYSDTIGRWSYIPKGFMTDWESVPLIRGTSKVSGAIHDYFSRKDSDPIVNKKTAADIYLEIMKYRKISFVRRYTKYWVVRHAPNYFHKMHVLDKLYIPNDGDLEVGLVKDKE